ncbi:hypothetical protein MNEG_8871, partial [Monoraphidium neglectum]
RLLTFDDVTSSLAAGPAPVITSGGLTFTGASAVAAPALPVALRAGVASAPVALTNTPALPGSGDGAIAFAPADGAPFTPLAMILTEAPDAALTASLGLPSTGEGRVVISCFGAAGAQLAAGTVRLLDGTPGRITFPPTCAGALRVTVAPAVSTTRLVLDDLAVTSGGAAPAAGTAGKRRRRRQRRLRERRGAGAGAGGAARRLLLAEEWVVE